MPSPNNEIEDILDGFSNYSPNSFERWTYKQHVFHPGVNSPKGHSQDINLGVY